MIIKCFFFFLYISLFSTQGHAKNTNICNLSRHDEPITGMTHSRLSQGLGGWNTRSSFTDRAYWARIRPCSIRTFK